MKFFPFALAVLSLVVPSAFSVVQAQPEIQTPRIAPVVPDPEAKTRSILVMGAVNHPGLVQAPVKVSLPELLTLAGGITPAGDSSQIRLKRNTFDTVLNLQDYLESAPGKMRADFAVQDGDILVIPVKVMPILRNRVTVMGAVKSPGNYEFKEELTVGQALELAGGVIDGDKANISCVKAVLPPEKGKEKPLPEVSKGVKMGQLLDNGDVLYIPVLSAKERGQGSAQARFWLLKRS